MLYHGEIEEEGCKFERYDGGEPDDAFEARFNLFEGLKGVYWRRIAFVTLTPSRELDPVSQCERMDAMFESFVRPLAVKYAFATHISGEGGGVDRHYVVELRCADGFYSLAGKLLRAEGHLDGIYSIEVGRLDKSRAALASYLTRQMRNGEADRLTAIGIKRIVYSLNWGRQICGEKCSNSEFARSHRRILRMVALNHGLKTEAEYWSADSVVKRRLNYEADILNRASFEKRAGAFTRNQNGDSENVAVGLPSELSMRNRRRRTHKPGSLIADPQPSTEQAIGPNDSPHTDDSIKRVETAQSDFRTLVDAIETAPMNLGDLRRLHGLQPTTIGRLCTNFPDLFSAFEQSGKPFVRLKVSPLDAVLSFVSKQAPEFGEIVQRGATAERVKASETDKAALAEAKARLAADRDRLIGLLEFARYSPWLEEQGFSMSRLREINLAYPNTLSIQANTLGQLHQFYVSLVGAEQGEASDALPVIVQSAPKADPINLNFSDADRASLNWKPKSRFAGTNRRAGRAPIGRPK